jgi:predicted metal-dependent phosphoesterase TrpH
MVWRRVDLHTQTTQDEGESAVHADRFVKTCIASGLDVVAVTDHDSLEAVGAVAAAGEAAFRERARRYGR